MTPRQDFRAVPPGEIDWSGRYRGQPAARLAGGERVVVQAPLACCAVTLAGAGMYRVDIKLRHDVPVHAEFAAWLNEIDEAAAGCPGLAEWREGRGRSDTLYRSNWRLMAFSDTLCFDSQGKLSFDLPDAAACSCLVELQGGWSSPGRWGVRWKVLEIKFDKSPPDWASPEAPAPVATDPGPRLSRFAFVED